MTFVYHGIRSDKKRVMRQDVILREPFIFSAVNREVMKWFTIFAVRPGLCRKTGGR